MIVVKRNSYSKAVIYNLIRTPIVGRMYHEFRDIQAELCVNNGHVVNKKVKTKVYISIHIIIFGLVTLIIIII